MSDYDNIKVIEKFKTEYPNAKTKTVDYKHKVSKELFPNLLEMTPLMWHNMQGIDLEKNQINEITVEVDLLVSE